MPLRAEPIAERSLRRVAFGREKMESTWLCGLVAADGTHIDHIGSRYGQGAMKLLSLDPGRGIEQQRLTHFTQRSNYDPHAQALPAPQPSTPSSSAMSFGSKASMRSESTSFHQSAFAGASACVLHHPGNSQPP